MDKHKADELLISDLPQLFGFAMKKSFSYAEAEELCSEMVAELYESLLKAKEIYNPDGYVRRIAAQCMPDMFRLSGAAGVFRLTGLRWDMRRNTISERRSRKFCGCAGRSPSLPEPAAKLCMLIILKINRSRGLHMRSVCQREP